jgi:muramoyltetrapeptide carboxypeptidase
VIGVFAASSQVPRGPLLRNLQRIRIPHLLAPNLFSSHRFFAGTDEERASAFWDLAKDPTLTALWGARGGSGALRILPFLDRLTKQHGPPPKKRLLGYSDITSLLLFTHRFWKWETLHAPVLCSELLPTHPQLETLLSWALGQDVTFATGKRPFQALTAFAPPQAFLPIWGGNLITLASLAGTPFGLPQKPHLLILEDVGEPLYKLDRALSQLVLSGSLAQTKAILLGEWLGCFDQSPTYKNGNGETKALRPIYRNMKKGLSEIFLDTLGALKVPTFGMLPFGHGPRLEPILLGHKARLQAKTKGFILEWWLPRESNSHTRKNTRF